MSTRVQVNERHATEPSNGIKIVPYLSYRCSSFLNLSYRFSFASTFNMIVNNFSYSDRPIIYCPIVRNERTADLHYKVRTICRNMQNKIAIFRPSRVSRFLHDSTRIVKSYSSQRDIWTKLNNLSCNCDNCNSANSIINKSSNDLRSETDYWTRYQRCDKQLNIECTG